MQPDASSRNDLCTLTVTFALAPQDRAGFLALVRENAAFSVQNEPGCLRFDVLVPLDTDCTVLLYEIYRSRDDFDRHLAADHYKQFDRATQGMVRTKTVVFHHLAEYAKSLSIP